MGGQRKFEVVNCGEDAADEPLEVEVPDSKPGVVLPFLGLALLGVVALTALALLAPGGLGKLASVHTKDLTSLAESTCTATDADCQQVNACCEAGQKCFRKNVGWAACRAECDPEAVDSFDGQKWTCELLGGDSDGAAGGEAAAPPGLPKCSNVSDKDCLEKKCSISDGGAAGDCLKTWCCAVPGSQCYEQNEWWGSCKATCEKSDGEGGWTCRELGPRTPGDTHAWEPCAEAKKGGKEKEHPLLADGDVGKAWDAAEARATKLLGTLKLEDKVALLRGQNDPWPNDRHGYAGYINPDFYFRNKCAMPLMLNDGPQGYNHYQKKLAGTTTQFPSLLAVAASFDPEVAHDYAEAIAAEFVNKGANVMLGPDIEVGRNPLSGRSFETLSGEDPFLGSQLVAPFVQATLKKGIIVTVKHWLDNNEEDYRQTMSVNVTERAQHEIYMPVFKAAIDAGAGAVMCAYNKVSGISACENEHLLKKLLRKDLGFRGFVMSDWGATHNAEHSAKRGLDMEMPGGADDKFHTLPDLVADGKLDEEIIDKMASHVLASMYAAGLFDGQFEFSSTEAALDKNVTSDAHRKVARETIVKGAVLLKNSNDTLPLQLGKGSKIALVGKYCKQTLDKSYGQGDVFSGGGSGWVQTDLTVTPLQGIREHFKDAEVSWSASAADVEEDADVAIVCAAGHSEEGWDRANLTLPEAEALVAALRTQVVDLKIVVLAILPGAVTTEWVEDADAVIALFMPGEQVGPAVAQLLDGTASPSGRLPVSLPSLDEQRFTQQQYPGFPFNDVNMTSNWSEGVLVGYRWNDAKRKSSSFPFGFGLSYTSFEFNSFKVGCSDGNASVSMQILNTGLHDGTAVPQLYVSFPSLQPMVRQLRGFRKVKVKASFQAEVHFKLDSDDWRVWSEKLQRWTTAVELGEIVTVSIGTSSADMLWSQELDCLPTDKPKEIVVRT